MCVNSLLLRVFCLGNKVKIKFNLPACRLYLFIAKVDYALPALGCLVVFLFRRQRAYAQHGGELRGKIFLCFKKIMYFCNKKSDGGNL